DMEQLQALDLSGIAITAEHQQGTLRPVGELWTKCGPALMDCARRGLIHTVVVAADQHDVPPEYLGEDATPLRVLPAATVADAVDQLYHQTLSRRAVCTYERQVCQYLDLSGAPGCIQAHYQALPLFHAVTQMSRPGAQGLSLEDAYI